MKKYLIAFLLVVLLAAPCEAARAQKVKGYYKKSTGTYVMPSYRTKANSTKLDNYSTRGNTNPYSGKKGYKDPYQTKTKKW